ncbi:hypothetical protein Tco_0129194, partial [Tanacetum coccineum]
FVRDLKIFVGENIIVSLLTFRPPVPAIGVQGECDIGDEGEWTGAVCGHTCTSISVLGEQGSASGTLSGTSVKLLSTECAHVKDEDDSMVLVEEGKAKVIEFDEIDKAFCGTPRSGTTNEIIDGWTIHFGLDMRQTECIVNGERNEHNVLNLQELQKHMSSEGFDDVGLRYVGGRWVWLEFDSMDQVKRVKTSKALKEIFLEFKDEDVRGVESNLVDSFEEGEIRDDSVLYNDGLLRMCNEKEFGKMKLVRFLEFILREIVSQVFVD